MRQRRRVKDSRSGALNHHLGVVELFSGWHSTRNTCKEYLTWPPMVYHAGIAPPSYSRSARRDVPWLARGSGDVGAFLCTSVLVSDSCEAPMQPHLKAFYHGHFGAWVNVRVRCGLLVFLQHCNDSMTNVSQLIEYVALAFATEKLRSAIKFSHRISRGFDLDSALRLPRHRECLQRCCSFGRRRG